MEVVRGNYTQETGYRCARALLSCARPPTAIFAANDLTALGVLGAARELDLVAGETLDLVGFDDITIAAYDYVSLTTISYPRSRMGQIARELVQRRCADRTAAIEVRELEPKLIVRNTVRKNGSRQRRREPFTPSAASRMVRTPSRLRTLSACETEGAGRRDRN